MTRYLARAVFPALVLLAAAPAVSHGAIVSMFGDLSIQDIDGEVNRIEVSFGTPANTFVISDSASPLEINGGSNMYCSHPDPADQHTVNCTQPAPGAPKIQELSAGEGNDDVTVAGEIDIQEMFGGGGNDTLRGGSKADLINGEAGDDTVVGGAGADRLYGAGGADTLQARDGEDDALITCGDGVDSAVLDAADPDPIACETVDRGGGGGEGGTSIKVMVPDVRPQNTGRGRYRLQQVAGLTAKLKKLGVPYRVKRKRVAFAGVPKPVRPYVENGDIVRQAKSPFPRTEVEVDPACPAGRKLPCRLEITVTVYDESKDLKGNDCFYELGSRQTAFFLELFDDAAYEDALRVLDIFHCDYRVVRWIEVKGATDWVVRGANVSKARGKKDTKRFYISLVVERPRRSDFTLGITGRPHSDYETFPARRDDFDGEIDKGVDGALTAGRTPGVVTVIVNENWTGRFVRSLKLEAVREDGVVLASTKTQNTGATTFTLPLDWTGDLDIHAVVSVEGGDEMAAWVTIPVVDRKQQPFYTETGRYFTFQNGRYVLTQRPQVPALQRHAGALEELAIPFGDEGAACRQVLASSALPQDKLRRCWELDDIQLTEFSSGGRTDGGLNFAALRNLPGFLAGGGSLAPATLASVVIPGAGAASGASLLASNGSKLVPNPQALIGQDGGSLIGQDGGSIVSDYTGGLTPPARGPVTRLEGQLLVGANASSFISENGGALIGQDGGSLIGQDGGSALPVVAFPGR